MNAIALSVTDVARNFSEYINRVAYRGDRFVLMKSGREMAELRPVPKGRHLSELAALLKTSARLTPEEADSFGRDMDVIRNEINSAEVRNPWDS
jgi:antitoxin (DNA-binding transcriptional repressor) of toxin-antitoxin stability system